MAWIGELLTEAEKAAKLVSTAETQLDTLKNQAAQAQSELDGANKELAARRASLASLTEESKTLTKSVNDMKSLLGKNKTTDELDSEIAAKTAQVAELNASLDQIKRRFVAA